VQVDEWRVRRAGSLKICSSQLEFAERLLGGSSKGRTAEIQSLRKAARSVSELLRSGMPLVSAEDLHQVSRHLCPCCKATQRTVLRLTPVQDLGPPSRRSLLTCLSMTERQVAVGVMLGDASLQTQDGGKRYRLKLLQGDKNNCHHYDDQSLSGCPLMQRTAVLGRV